ncbi:unnamed protein product [Cyprideis torosa]|uniref:Uncharacterized protein n=1 Tax=Cyprideis torosa TaxID=163714 RepID=A0A7R8ZRY4_9CRUS|nr:unnamed protein product [Cyprideis torosa]CAG0894253.1 unnamed protein product [Cyprideis torosa]
MLGPVLIISVASCLPLHIICGSVDIDANEDSNLPFVLDELKLENSQRIGRGPYGRPSIYTHSIVNVFPKVYHSLRDAIEDHFPNQKVSIHTGHTPSPYYYTVSTLDYVRKVPAKRIEIVMNMLGTVLIISVASCLPLHIICGSVDIDANEDSNLPFVLDELKLENSQRIGRGLMSFRPRIVSINSLFNIVTFPKGQCNSTDTGLSGTCYNYNEFQKSCRNITSEAISYFINPSYPASDQTVQVCDYRIDIPSTRQGKSLDGETTTSRICQVRLDFEEFTLPEPEPSSSNNNGQCLRSKIMLTGSAGVTYRVAQFCGVLTGQHMYLEVNPDLEDSTYFSLMAIVGVENPSDPVPQYSWKIKITQINCATENYLRVQKSCRNITSEAISYFINPSYPASDQTVQVCDYRIDIPSTRQGKSLDGETTTSRICQVRLDFEEFTLPEPEPSSSNNNGQCLRSKIMLTGSAGVTYRVAQFCGVLTGQHMYLEVNPDLEDSTYFSLMAIVGVENPSDPVPQYSWKIKITQINCATENYLRGTGGYFRSLDYDICLRTEVNACAVEWKADAFDIFGSSTPGANGDAVCQQDYLIIPQCRSMDPSPFAFVRMPTIVYQFLKLTERRLTKEVSV